MSGSLLLFGLLLAGTGIMRLVEVVVSVRRMQAKTEEVIAEPWLFPAMVILHLGFVVAPWMEVWLLQRPFSWLVGGFALTVLSAATVLRIWTLWTLGGAWNVRVVRPGEDAVVTTGPYAWIRHPNYLVVILEIVALPMVHGAWVSALGLSVFNAVVLSARIRTEEATLEQLPAWRSAMANRARLIPGVF
jgi:methyltransferase